MTDPKSFHFRQFVPAPHEFSDDEAAELLRRIYCWVKQYDWTEDSITSVVTDLAQSMDRTTNSEDQMRREIEEQLYPESAGQDPNG